MGQVLHGSATTTHAIRAAIQRSKASIQALSERYGINSKTLAKWRKRTSLEDRPIGPPRSALDSPIGRRGNADRRVSSTHAAAAR